MPAKPIAPETLQLIDAVRDALLDCTAVEEKTMFGCHVFMVDGKMCLGVENDELLVRLPPASHAQIAEMPGVRPLSSRGLMDGYFLVGPTAYARREQWQHWISEALAFNPLAKATPKRKTGSKTGSKASSETDSKKLGDGESPAGQGTSSGRRRTRAAPKPADADAAGKHPIFDSE
ncbi:MAG: TfoX/Sxy family protein [Comamonas sp.]|uniref:TfoX/Sxy family protein n=1 Tax=Comamonas sp. TaxID=34028 RepID=UPI0026492B9A|nr:TfoX/Sxy family protein [Comamonas sp.]MDN5507075.1 TfoX/Sxy family protein [Comamonas sp.]MDN5538439.1 TfoX/Sxy family protein [Comamonas sp.]